MIAIKETNDTRDQLSLVETKFEPINTNKPMVALLFVKVKNLASIQYFIVVTR